MHITIALLGLSPMAWFFFVSVFVMIVILINVKQQNWDSIAERMVERFLDDCDRKKASLGEYETCEVLGFFCNDDRGCRRAWASARLSNNSISIWVERSNLATCEDIEEMRRFHRLLSQRGYSVTLDVVLYSSQPAEPAPENEEQPA